MDLVAFIKQMCTPAFLYTMVHIGLLAIVVLRYISRGALLDASVLWALIVHAIIVAAVAFVLNWMCKKGLGVVSWLVALMPFLVMLTMPRKPVNVFDPNPLSALF